MRETKQNGMRVRLFGALLALAGGAVLAGHAAPASAATTTTVTCFKPVTQISTGQGGTFDQPRWTLQCLGGSTASNVTFFAWRLADDPYVAPLLEEAFGHLILAGKPPASVTILTNLSDISGNAWGCGSANCRKISFLMGY